MAVLLQELIPAVTADEVETVMIGTLQGLGPVQQIGTGAGTLSVNGAPLGNYDVQVVITTGGNPGTAAFTYSLDGGKTVNGPQGVPSNGTYSLSGSGMTLQFSGALQAKDRYLWQTIYPQFPVTSWESGDVGTTWVKGEGETISDFAGNLMGEIAGGGFVDYAEDDNSLTDWLSLLSDQTYNNQRFNAQVLSGQVVLSLASGSPSVTKNPGEIIISNGLGSGPNVVTYTNSSSVTMSPGSTQVVPVTATAPGAKYNVSNGVLTVLQTPVPGLSANNPAPGTSAITPSGGATGTVAVSGSPNGNYNFVMRVLSTGPLGTATAQISVDGGQNFSSPFTIPASGSYAVNQPNSTQSTGLTLTFTPGTFTAGDSYSFTSYASWILTPGQDVESGSALRTRDKSRWGTLGVGGGTSSAWDFVCRQAPSGGSEVVKTQSAPDPAIAGQFNIVVAGQNGPVSTAALAAISSYVAARVGLTASATVSNASVRSVTVSGTVSVVASQLSAAKAAISTALSNYASSVGISGLVEWTEIVAAIVNQSPSGVTNYAPSAPLSDVQLGATEVVQFTLSLNYVLV